MVTGVGVRCDSGAFGGDLPLLEDDIDVTKWSVGFRRGRKPSLKILTRLQRKKTGVEEAEVGARV